MIKEIKIMKTWKEAERWLAKHGYGIEQIREQKELWDAETKTVVEAKSNKPVVKAETTTKSTTVKK